MTTKKILCISGSLRPNSSTQHIIRHLITAGAAFATMDEYLHIGKLPHFDDHPNPGPEVIRFRKAIQESDAVIFCLPEYAFGVPGSLKNAIDWTVSSGEFVGKPIAIITAATGGEKAHASLILTFTALSAQMDEKCLLLVPFIRSKINTNGDITDPLLADNISTLIKTLTNSTIE